MVDGKMKERSAFVNLTLVSKVGIGEATKENKSTKESYNSCYCEALCYFSDINNVHNVVSTFLYYVILFFFYRLVSIRSVCILQVIIGRVLFRQGIILI